VAYNANPPLTPRVLVAWGDSSSGKLDIPAGLTDVIAIDARENFSLALKADGSVVAWAGPGIPWATGGLSQAI